MDLLVVVVVFVLLVWLFCFVLVHFFNRRSVAWNFYTWCNANPWRDPPIPEDLDFILKRVAFSCTWALPCLLLVRNQSVPSQGQGTFSRWRVSVSPGSGWWGVLIHLSATSKDIVFIFLRCRVSYRYTWSSLLSLFYLPFNSMILLSVVKTFTLKRGDSLVSRCFSFPSIS